MRCTLEPDTHAGHEARRLGDLDRRLEAVFLPGLGMLGVSLTHRGEELLGRTDNLPRYEAEGSTLGIPLLHPWANRLGGLGYEAVGRRVELDPGSALLHLDAHGLPIHGVAGPQLPWRLTVERVTSNGAFLGAELDYSSEELLAVFPFPHALRQEVLLAADGLTVTTSLSPAGDCAVPVAFGYHPYLRLPGAAREAWRVELPVMRRLLLDGRPVPTGEEEPYDGLSGTLDRDYDDGFTGVPDGTRFALEGGGRRVEVTFVEGYPFAQVFAPPGQDFVCLEPMTAPANALGSGLGLRVADPGETFRASFRVSVTDA